jgi:hypothetical protein
MNKYPAICFVALGCALSIALLFTQGQIELETAFALCIGIIVLAAVLLETITISGDGIDLSISNLPSLYGFVYALYYLNALVLFGLRNDVSKENIIEISALILLGYVGWRSGFGLAVGSNQKLPIPVFGHREAGSLLSLCWLGFGMVMVGYAYKASVGAFYAHGAEYTQDTNLAASFLQNATFPFEFPVIMLSALLSATGTVRRRAKITLWIFASMLCIVHLLASEFRWIVTDLALIAAVLQLVAGLRLTWLRVAMGSCICILVLLSIQGARMVAAARGGGSVGPMESVSLLVEGLATATDSSAGATAVTKTSERGSESSLFLSTVIDRVKSGAPYIYGKVMLDELSSVVPRAVWPDKPSFESTQISIKREFGLPEKDDSPGPLVPYYAFGGPIGVFCWLFLFGFCLGRLQLWVARDNGILPWLVLIWVLGGAVVIERDQVLGVVMTLRHCLVAYAAFVIILFFYPNWGPKRSSANLAKYPTSVAAS